MTYRDTHRKIYTYNFMYTNSCFILVLYFMLPTCRSNFADMLVLHETFRWPGVLCIQNQHFFYISCFSYGSCKSYQPHLPWFNPPNSISLIQYSRIEQNEGMCQPMGSLHCGPQGEDTSEENN